MLNESSKLDLDLAHRHFAAHCFNDAWTLIDKRDRSDADTEAMILCALASLWHWTQRSDCTNRALSIGHWQVSRVYALAGQGENAMHHAKRSLALAEGLSAFYVAYAHEAVARAAAVLHDPDRVAEQLKQAVALCEQVADVTERQALENDLKSLQIGR